MFTIKIASHVGSHRITYLVGNELSNYIDAGQGFIAKMADWDISYALVNPLNHEIIGAYVLVKDDLSNYIPNEKYTNNGLLASALWIREDERGKGYGKQLIEYVETHTPAEYIWEMNLKSYNNIDFWLKYREIVHETDMIYFTAKKLIDGFNIF